uniref:Uncharacterized protein n=1 Tax=viral metagenome TaxID=1070528 RepID=A0A6H1ZJA3_9ZZZZ
MNAKEKAIKFLDKHKTTFDSLARQIGRPIWSYMYFPEALDIAIKEAKKELLDIIRTYQNPYPKDIFLWDNTGKIDFSRGRFNKHCYQIVEGMRSDLLKELEENEV